MGRYLLQLNIFDIDVKKVCPPSLAGERHSSIIKPSIIISIGWTKQAVGENIVGI